MQSRQPDDPQNNIQMSEDEIHALSASLRTTRKERGAERITDGVAEAASGIVQRILAIFRIPLSFIAAFAAFILIAGIADHTFLGRIGGAFLTLVITWIVIGRIVFWLDIRQFKAIR